MNYFLYLSIIVFVYMNFWFVISLIKKRNDVADVAWGLGFVVLAWSSYLLSSNNTIYSLIINCLVTIWGGRLAYHIYSRNKNKNEDYRYAKWRQDWGKWFYLRSYFQVYILQGFLLYLISISVMFINKDYVNNFSYFYLIGILIWVIGFSFESIGDYQLKKFISNPQNSGKLMKIGLWKYSRHPNYFGEVTQWWGIWWTTLVLKYYYITLISPLVITYLILKVSGIPMLEKKMEENPDFAEYKRTTSVFIPWFNFK